MLNDDLSFSGRTLDDQTKAEIAQAYPGMDIHYVEVGSVVTMEIRMDRVRVWYYKQTNEICEAVIG